MTLAEAVRAHPAKRRAQWFVYRNATTTLFLAAIGALFICELLIRGVVNCI